MAKQEGKGPAREENGVDETETKKPVRVYQGRYRISSGGNVLEEGEAKSTVEDDRLVLLPQNGARADLFYRDIARAEASDYGLALALKSGETAEVYYLGGDYDSYTGRFFAAYDAMARKDRFMAEQAECVKKGARYLFTGPEGQETGACDVYFGDTAVILQRVQAAPARVPYALIEEARFPEYAIRFALSGGSMVELSMLADRYDACRERYDRHMAALAKAAADGIREAKPDIPPLALRKAAQLFLDGRAVSREQADAVCEGLWDAVYARCRTYGAEAYFDALYKIASDARIGFKRSLRTGDADYLWMLAFIGGFAVMEAASQDRAARATYVFKTCGDAAETARLINTGMHMTEFRREPVHLSESELEKQENAGYREALRSVPELARLRGLFVKRIAHTTPGQWQKTIQSLIR